MSLQWRVLFAAKEPEDRSFRRNWGHFVCAIVGGFIFVRCFNELRANFVKLFVFDIKQRKWALEQFRGKPPKPLRGNSVTALNDILVFIGNEPNQHGYLDFIFIGDLPLREWQKHAVLGNDFIVERGHTAVYQENANSVIIHTSNKGRYTNVPITVSVPRNETYILSMDTFVTKRLETKGHVPTERRSHAALFVDSSQKMFVAGGITTSGPRILLGDMHILDFATGRGMIPTWSQPLTDSRLTRGFQRATMLMLDSHILIIGGSPARVPGTEVIAVYSSNGKPYYRTITHGGDTPNSDSFRKSIMVQPSNKRLFLIPREPSEEGVRCFQARYTPGGKRRNGSQKRKRKGRRTIVEGRKGGGSSLLRERARATSANLAMS